MTLLQHYYYNILQPESIFENHPPTEVNPVEETPTVPTQPEQATEQATTLAATTLPDAATTLEKLKQDILVPDNLPPELLEALAKISIQRFVPVPAESIQGQEAGAQTSGATAVTAPTTKSLRSEIEEQRRLLELLLTRQDSIDKERLLAEEKQRRELLERELEKERQRQVELRQQKFNEQLQQRAEFGPFLSDA